MVTNIILNNMKIIYENIKKINFVRVIIFFLGYLGLSYFMSLLPGILLILIISIPILKDSIMIISSISLGSMFIVPLTAYLVVYILTLTKLRIFKFKLSERFIGVIIIPLILDSILAIWIIADLVNTNFDSYDDPGIGLFLWPIIILSILIVQIFVFALGETIIFGVKKLLLNHRLSKSLN